MRTRDRYLSSLLLVLIGVLLGIILAFFQMQNGIDDRADVQVTEIKHSTQPLFTGNDLEKIDGRFLFQKISKKVIPTVVYIETIVPISGNQFPDDEYHDEEGFWGNILPKRARTVGSGILISSDGYILTNNHVINETVDEHIEVVLKDKRVFNARIVGQDPTTDLAVIKIDANGVPAITIGNSDELEVGEWVLAVGNPFRLRSTVTAGIVSALSRDVQIINDQMRVESFIQTDAAINKGNSGGALVNTSGELVGVNTAIASRSGSYQGYGFAVPSNLAAKVAHDIIEYGEVRRALLGVTIVSMNAVTADELDMDRIRGVLVTALSPNGAAEDAGLAVDDIILSINGMEVNESNQLQQKIAVMNPGDNVELEIYRNGETIEKVVELGMMNNDELRFVSNEQKPEKDNSDEVSSAIFDIGIKVMGLPMEEGGEELVITKVEEDTEAARKGLKEGFVIKKIDNQKVEDLKSLRDLMRDLLQRKGSIILEVETRKGEIESYELQK